MFNAETGLDGWLLVILAAFVAMVCGTALAANNPTPFIDLPVVPAAAVPGGPGFMLTVNGAGFVTGSVVNWNGSPRTTTFVSAGQITASILGSDIATAGTASITVSNPAPGGGFSTVTYFEITTPASTVTLAGLQVPDLANFNGPRVADLNHDGKLDLIVFLENQEGENPYVALGNGDGTFQPPVAIAGGLVESPGDLVVADFNKDGNLDIGLRTCCNVPSTISILLGNGDGTFQPPMFTGGQNNTVYNGLAVGDFNQDGNLDIVTNYSNPPDSGISVLLGNGDGTFLGPVNYIEQYAGMLVVGDFNGDGVLDLIIQQGGNNPGAVTATMLGNGDGTFQAPVISGSGLFLQSASAGDVNGDGKLDLIAWSFEDDPSFFVVSAGVSLGDNNGTFTPAGGGVTGFPAFPPGDFNGDGKLDFVISPGVRFPPTDDLFLAPGNGDGTFGSAVALQTSTGLTLIPLVQGDFNGDGTQDLLAAANGGFWLFLQGSFLVGNASPAILNFASQAVGMTSASQIVAFRNTGSGMLTLSPISITGPNSSEFNQINTCTAMLAIGAQCQVTVTFVPAAIGARSATLSVPNNGIGSNAVPIFGVGADFSMTLPTPPSVTVAAGKGANYDFDVEPQGGLTGTVSLNCGGAPAGAKCMLPGSVRLDGLSNAKVAVSVTTTPRTNALNRGMFSGNGRWLACGVLGLPLVVTLAGVGGRRRAQLRQRMFQLVITLAMLVTSACSGGNSGGSASGTPAGTYLLTVAGKYTAGGATLTHTVTLTLVVE
jgi:hypothetical protein